MQDTQTATLEAALVASLHLLPGLGRSEVARESVTAEIERLDTTWPELGIQLAAFPDPVRHTVDYDILFNHPQGGTVALSYAPEDGIPWVARFAESQEAYLVAKVNEDYITFQTGLLALQLDPQSHQLFDRMITASLLGQAVQRDKIDVSGAEIQEAMDQFRRAHGLHSASATHQWLVERGLSHGEFQRLMTRIASTRKLRREMVANKTELYFAEHRADFDRVTIVRASVEDRKAAESLAAAAQDRGDLLLSARTLQQDDPMSVEVSLQCRFRRDLSSQISELITEEKLRRVIGPLPITGSLGLATSYEIFQATDIRSSRLDPLVQSAVEDSIFQEWLKNERESARISWFLK